MESYSQRKILRKKVIVTKLGLDGHDRGAKVIAHSLMEAGYEVVYLGVHRNVQQVVSAVVQEDAALLAVSVLSGAHLELAKDLISEMKRQKVNCPIVMGGIIPRQDIAKLKRMGIKEVFGSGTSLELIEEAVGKWIK